MEIYEITGYQTGIANDGVNFLSPADSFDNVQNGFIYRQVLQSRPGFGYFSPRLVGNTRIFGIFEHIIPNGEKLLLAFDQNFLYKYNLTTGIFNQVPFGGSLAAYTGFNIGQKDWYISGTSYPTATNGPRFVFTGLGITPNAGSSVFFYDGDTASLGTVKDFTDLGDNPNYQPPLINGVPTQLNKAKYVFWFGERLNFISPTIGNIDYTQAVLYSGIRTVSGNGDKFAIAGSGMLSADTYNYITGASILGQVLALNFNRSNWTLEKTKDAFNPYFIREVPSVEGTNADFSAVAYFDKVNSIGITGILSTDGRQSLRMDNKIPRFTQNEIDPLKFNYTYGGFDRINNQFIWSYVEAGTEATTQNQVLVNNYEESTWSFYDQRFSVFGQTDLGLNLTWDEIEGSTDNPSWDQWNTTDEIWDNIGQGLSVQKTLAGDDLGFIYQYTEDFNDYYASISAIDNVTGIITVNASGFKPGDRVAIQDVLGMTEINNFSSDPSFDNAAFKPWTVVTATPTSITIDEDLTNFGVYISGGSIVKTIPFEARMIPFNPWRSIGRKCYVSHIEFLIDNNNGFMKLDIYEDEESDPIKANVLCQPKSNSVKAREWITVTVDNEANFHTFVMKQESPAYQLRITSVRLHCMPGGYTSG